MAPSVRRVAALSALIAALAAAIALIVAHVPAVRARALAYASRQLATRYGLDLQAARLDYNLLTRRVALTDVRLSARGHEGDPFFRAGRVEVALPWSVFAGRLAFSRVDVFDAAVSLRRDESGASNLPGTGAPRDPNRPPVHLDVRAVRIDDLDFTYEDERRGLSIAAGGLHAALEPSGAPDLPDASGLLSIGDGVRVAIGDREIAAQPIAGLAAFDGSNVFLKDVTLATAEGAIGIAGRIDRVLDAARLDLRLDGTANVAEAAKWGTFPVSLGGRTALSGTITGTVGEPTIAIDTSSHEVIVGRVSGISQSAHVTVTTSEVTIDKASVGIGGGALRASATIPFDDDAQTTVAATWDGLDARTLLGVLDRPDAPIAARMTGAVRYARTGGGPLALSVDNEAVPIGSASNGAVPIAGTLRLRAENGVWRLQQQHTLPGTLSVSGGLGGRLDNAAFSHATIEGNLDTAIDDVGRAATAVERLGLDLPAVVPSLKGPAKATVALAGRLDALETTAVADSDALQVPGLAPQRVHAEVATTPETVRVSSVEAGIDDARLRGEAEIDLVSRQVKGRFDVDAPNIDVLLSDLPGGITAQGPVTARATLGGSTSDPEVVVDVRGEHLETAGQPVDELDAHARIAGGAIDVQSFALRQEDGSLTGSGRYAWGTREYSAEVDGSGLRWTGQLIGSTPSTVRLTSVRYDGSGTVERPGGTAEVSFEIAGGVAGTLVGEGNARARFADGAASVLARVPALGAFLDTRIATQAPYAYDAVAVIHRLDLATLAPLLGAPGGTIAGIVSLSATSSGEATDLAASRAFVNLQDVNATVAEVPVALNEPSRLSWHDETLDVDALHLTVGQGRLDASGSLAQADRSRWNAAFDGELGDVLRISRAFGAPAELDGAGHLTASWQSEAGIDASTGAVAINGGSINWGTVPPITALTLQASFDGTTLAVPTLTAAWQKGAIQGTATLPRARLDEGASNGTAPPGRIELHLTDLPAAAFEPWIGAEALSRIKGQLSASLDAEVLGPRLEDMNAVLTLDQAAFTVAAVDVRQSRPSTIRLDRGIVTMQDVAWTFGGSPLLLTGTVGLAPTNRRWLDLAFAGDMDLRVLAAFAPTTVTEGAATVDIWASGRPDDPQLTGLLHLRDASVALREPRILISQLNGPVRWQRGTIGFDGVTGVANGGDLSLFGALTTTGLRITGGQVIAQVRRMALEYPSDLQSEISALVTLSPQKDDWILAGDVRIIRSAYTEPVSLAALLTRRQSRPPAVRASGPSFADRLRLNLFVVTEEDLRVDNNYGRIEAGGAVRVLGTAGRPGMTGGISMRDGSEFYLAGNTFYIERGSVTFTSANRIEPEIDMLARGLISGREVQLTLSGTPSNLKTEVHPTDPTETDRDARDALYSGLVGDEQALTLLSGELLGVTGRALGLDALRIERGLQTDELRADPTLIATETDPSTRLTLSKRLPSDVEVTLSQSLSESGALSAIVSYKPRRTVEVRASSRDNIDRSIAVRHEITFGGEGTPTAAASRQPRVSSIQLTGDRPLPEKEIRSDLRLHENDRFNFHEWQRGVDEVRQQLLEQGYYEARVRATREVSPDESSVALAYEIERGPRTRLVIEGHPVSAALHRELEQAWTRIVFDQFLLDEIRTRITRQLLAEGLLGSTVDARVTVSTPEEKEVRVTIDPGTRVSKREIRFTGNQSIDSSRLQDVISQQDLDVDGWLNPPLVASAVEEYYREQGYLAAAASAGEPVVDGTAGVLPVTVEEGPRFTFVTVAIAGASDRRPPLIDRIARVVAPGDPYDRAAIDRATVRIERAYRRRGFNDVQVDPQVSVDAGLGTVALTFQIDEGLQQILRDVSTEGATRTSSRTIRRALRLEPGQPVNLERWSQSRKRMYDTNVFRQVDIEPVPMEPTPQDEANGIQPVRAVVRVVEYPVWRLRYGLQYREERGTEQATARSTQSGFGVLGDLQNRNLFGRAVNGGLAVSLQPDRLATSLFGSNASFFGLPITSNAFLFAVNEQDPPIDSFETNTDRRGVSFEQRWRPLRRTELTWGYRYEWTHIYETDPVDVNLPILDEVVRTGRLRSALYVDRRDDPFNASRGWFSSINFDKASPALGADFPYTKLLFQQFYYRQAGPIVLATAARLGVAYRAENIDFDNRFFAGGGTTVRGYAEDALGPRAGSVPLGGGSLLILNQEVRFPIFSRLSGVTFVDAGNVWTTRGEIALGDLEIGYGFGLRVNTPFALLRVDYGIPTSSIPPGRRTGFANGRWYFGIGQIF